MRKGLGGLFVAAMLVFVLASAGAVKADNLAYEVTGSGDLGIVDLNTGVYTEVGNMGGVLSGLGEVNDVIYGGANGGAMLYSVNPTSGALTPIGNGSMDLLEYRFHAHRAVRPRPRWGSLVCQYVHGRHHPDRIDRHHLRPPLYSFNEFEHVVSCRQRIPLRPQHGHWAPTLLGSTGTTGISSLVMENSVLFAAIASPQSIDTLNPATGADTSSVAETGARGYSWGLAPMSAPIPGAALLLGFGLVGLAAARRRFKK